MKLYIWLCQVIGTSTGKQKRVYRLGLDLLCFYVLSWIGKFATNTITLVKCFHFSCAFDAALFSLHRNIFVQRDVKIAFWDLRVYDKSFRTLFFRRRIHHRAHLFFLHLRQTSTARFRENTIPLSSFPFPSVTNRAYPLRVQKYNASHGLLFVFEFLNNFSHVSIPTNCLLK